LWNYFHSLNKERPLMKRITKERKESANHFQNFFGKNDFLAKVAQTIDFGKQAIDSLNHDVGKMLVESILLMDRESIAGPDYSPKEELYKWAHQPGSVYIGQQKVKVSKPRLRGPDGEIILPSYKKLKERGQFSEELVTKLMSGLSGRRYRETITETAEAFGVSPSSVSRHFVEATSKQLKEFLERDLSSFVPFAIMLDTVHRGGVAFVTALGISIQGKKMVLGFWEGATENSELCKELLVDLESRGLKLTSRVIFVTDGGSGILKALREKFGKRLLLQRCIIHKDRNLQMHVAKKYRTRVHQMFKTALSYATYKDALAALELLEKELQQLNESAARSLREALPELLTLHRLDIRGDLYRVLYTTNGIENLFSSVRHRERNIKNYNSQYRGKKRKGKLSQRWLAAVFLKAEKNFRTIKGFEEIKSVIERIEKLQTEMVDNKNKKTA
jgi:putative transposase